MVSDWLRAKESGTEVRMLAARRVDIDELNRLARSELRSAGRLGDDVAGTAQRSFAVSDEVICLHNDRRLGVRNGTRGQVVSGSDGSVVLSTDDGERHLDRDYLEAGWLDHGYATTVHKSQGETVDRAFVLGTGGVYREAAYVAMSRAQSRSDLYVVKDDFSIGLERANDDPLADLKRLLTTSRAKVLATDVGNHRPVNGGSGGSDGSGALLDTKMFGNRPTAPGDGVVWDRAVESVGDYRRRFGVAEPSGLGARPDDPIGRSAFDSALEAVLAWERQRGRSRELEATGLGRGRTR
jgi:hypothetical protein